ncbi:hypothetical protein [Streptomyces sp. NPDC056883]|uniref:hypothetical protein n=1 Tax=Streptomyces sp. NPDC056883 TaxID=3345959 RepID=UPI003681DCF6
MSRVVVRVSGSLGSLAALRAGAREARLGGRDLEAAATLDRAFEEAFGGDPAGVPVVRRHVLRGDPGRTLCEPAGLPDDLLVVGARPGGVQARARSRPPIVTMVAATSPSRARQAAGFPSGPLSSRAP